MEVRHRSTDDAVRIKVTVLEPVDGLRHKSGDVLGGRSLIGRGSATRAGDVDRASAPEARELVALEVTGVEVQVEEDPR